MNEDKDFLGKEPVADFIAVSFTAVVFTFQIRKVIKKINDASNERV